MRKLEVVFQNGFEIIEIVEKIYIEEEPAIYYIVKNMKNSNNSQDLPRSNSCKITNL